MFLQASSWIKLFASPSRTRADTKLGGQQSTSWPFVSFSSL
jgi:hypothetical protein